MSGLTFNGCDPSNHEIFYRGGLGRLHSLSIDISPVLGVKHGSVIQQNTTRRQFVVVGVPVGDHSKELWVHQRGERFAICLKNLEDSADLQKNFTILPRQQSGSENASFLGPLGVTYTFNTSPTLLTAQWGVSAGEQFYLKQFEENVRICGELFGVLWVAKESQTNIAVPLPGCTSEDVLHNVFGLCQYVHTSSLRGPNTPRRIAEELLPSPRRATNTPRQTSQGSVPLNMDIDRSKEIVTCSGPFGTTVRCSFSSEALEPFGVTLHQKLVGKKGVDAGRFCRVVGVSKQSLFVLFDGETRVTCLRGIDGAATLKEAFGFGNETPNDDFEEKIASPRRPKTQKRFWTAFGRLPFDTSDAACSVFGFPHGQVLRLKKGVFEGKEFSVVGARSGMLWVVEDGQSRCVPLSHCQNKDEIERMYEPEVVRGSKRNLSHLYNLETEPISTPMNSPRQRLSVSPGRVPSEDRELSYSPVTHAKKVEPPVVQKSIPFLDLANATLNNQSQSGFASHASERIPSAREGQVTEGVSGSARQYLKAFALLKMGVSLHSITSSPAASLAFHEYYMQDTMRRIREAFDRLPKVKSLWEHEKRTPTNFFAADCAVILKFLQERPSVTTYR